MAGWWGGVTWQPSGHGGLPEPVQDLGISKPPRLCARLQHLPCVRSRSAPADLGSLQDAESHQTLTLGGLVITGAFSGQPRTRAAKVQVANPFPFLGLSFPIHLPVGVLGWHFLSREV